MHCREAKTLQNQSETLTAGLKPNNTQLSLDLADQRPRSKRQIANRWSQVVVIGAGHRRSAIADDHYRRVASAELSAEYRHRLYEGCDCDQRLNVDRRSRAHD